jgi:hypothetical protein
VIDPIDDEDPNNPGEADELAPEPQDIVEHDEPDLDWFACPMLPRYGDEMSIMSVQESDRQDEDTLQ